MLNKLPLGSAAALAPHLDAIERELLAGCEGCAQNQCFKNDASDCGNSLCAIHRAYCALTVLREETSRPTREPRMDILKALAQGNIAHG